nr:MAG TPA: hypothetical protein [Caudoviricetes sp.]
MAARLCFSGGFCRVADLGGWRNWRLKQNYIAIIFKILNDMVFPRHS